MPIGPDNAAQVCTNQISKGLNLVSTDSRRPNTVIVYEAAWAIGQSEAAGSDHIQQSAKLIRDFIDPSFPHDSMRIAYGGSAGPGLLHQNRR